VGLVGLTLLNWLVFDNIITDDTIILKGSKALISGNLTDIEAWFVVFGSQIATVLAAGLVVIGAPLIATMFYFKRKEYETIRQMYLDEDLVKIIQQVEYGLAYLDIIGLIAFISQKLYRDLGPSSPPDFHKLGFINFDQQISLEASRHYLLRDLIIDKVNFDVHQLLTGFLHEADNLFKVDLCSAMRVSLEGAKGGAEISSPQEIYESYKESLAKIYKESKPYYALLGNLQLIVSELSRKQYNFKSLNGFKNKPEVIATITSLKVIFKEELAKYAKSSASSEIEEELTKGAGN